MERKQRLLRVDETLLPSFLPVRGDDEKPHEAIWVDMGSLNQEILDDITSIYCQVYKIDPEDLQDTPDLPAVIGSITGGMGFYEKHLAGNKLPMLEVKRIRGNTETIIRFGATSVSRTAYVPLDSRFQEAADEYLVNEARVGRPLGSYTALR